MKLSPENAKIYEKLISEMLADGFERISENTFCQKIGNMSISIGDHALNIMHRGKCYGIIPTKEIFQLGNGLDSVLTQLKYLLAFSMRQDMNRMVTFFCTYFWN